MYLKELKINNFKGFQEYKVDLKPFTVLIGENNSGKTSILQVIQLIYDGFHFLFGNDTYPRFEGLNWQINLNNPISKFGLSKNELIFFKKKISPDVQLQAKWDNGLELKLNASRGTNFQFELFKDGELIRNNITDPQLQELIEGIYHSNAILLQPVGTITPTENFIAYPELVQRLARGKFNENWRAYLYWTFETGEKSAFEEVVDFIKNRIAGTEVLPPRLSKDSPAKFIIEYIDDNEVYDISSSGGGLRTLLALSIVLQMSKANCILLDEPDAHLHSGLQKELANILLEYSESKEIQLLIATHSPDLIDSVSLDNIISINRLSNEAEYVDNIGSALVSLGALTNTQAIAAIGASSIINLEGREDNIILSAYARKLDIAFPEDSDSRLVSTGKKNLKELIYIHRGLIDFFGINVKLIAINDLDYDYLIQEEQGLKEQKEEGVLLLTLGRKEIENYIIDANAIAETVNSQLERCKDYRETIDHVDSTDIQEMIEVSFENIKEHLSYRLKPLIRKKLSEENSRWEATKLEIETDSKFEELWNDDEWKLCACPGKTLLRNIKTEIQQRWGVSFSISRLANSIDTIPPDIDSIYIKIREFLEE